MRSVTSSARKVLAWPQSESTVERERGSHSMLCQCLRGWSVHCDFGSLGQGRWGKGKEQNFPCQFIELSRYTTTGWARVVVVRNLRLTPVSNLGSTQVCNWCVIHDTDIDAMTDSDSSILFNYPQASITSMHWWHCATSLSPYSCILPMMWFAATIFF